MATAKKLTGAKKSPGTRKSASTKRAGSHRGYGLLRGRWSKIVLAAGLLGVGLFYVYGGPLLGHARAGAAYGARIGCSCRYIDGRALGSCKDDRESGMGMVFLSEDAERKSVTARVPVLASATATYRKGWGCVLEKWDD